MLPRRIVPLLVAVVLTAPGCFATRAVGLGPDPGPDEVANGDPPDVVYEKAKRLYAAKQWSEAADAFGRVWRDRPDHELSADAQFYEAESRYGQGKYNGAFELYRSYLRDHPLTPYAPTIQRRLYDIGTYTIEAGQRAFFDYAGEGVDYLDFLVSAFPNGDLADNALFFMADYEGRERKFDDAIAHLHDLIDNYPSSEWALEARLRLARAYRERNRGTSYDAEVLRRAAAQYGAYIDLVSADRAREREYADLLDSARQELAEVEDLIARKGLEASDWYLKAGKTEAARQELRNVVRSYPQSPSAEEARRRLGVDGQDPEGARQ